MLRTVMLATVYRVLFRVLFSVVFRMFLFMMTASFRVTRRGRAVGCVACCMVVVSTVMVCVLFDGGR